MIILQLKFFAISTPANVAVDVADSLSEMLFNLPNELNIPIKEYQKAVEERALEFDILEGTTRKYGKIYSPALLELIEGYEDTTPFIEMKLG